MKLGGRLVVRNMIVGGKVAGSNPRDFKKGCRP